MKSSASELGLKIAIQALVNPPKVAATGKWRFLLPAKSESNTGSTALTKFTG